MRGDPAVGGDDIILDQGSEIKQLLPLVRDAFGEGRAVVVVGAMYVNTIERGNGGGRGGMQGAGIGKMDGRGMMSVPKTVRDMMGMVEGSEWSISVDGKELVLKRLSVL